VQGRQPRSTARGCTTRGQCQVSVFGGSGVCYHEVPAQCRVSCQLMLWQFVRWLHPSQPWALLRFTVCTPSSVTGGEPAEGGPLFSDTGRASAGSPPDTSPPSIDTTTVLNAPHALCSLPGTTPLLCPTNTYAQRLWCLSICALYPIPSPSTPPPSSPLAPFQEKGTSVCISMLCVCPSHPAWVLP